MARGLSPSKTTEILLWSSAGGRCQICNKPLGEHLQIRRPHGKFGLVAHIVASDPNGTRGCPVRSPQLASSLSNLMLLCYECHKEIDSAETWHLYTEEKLQKIKREQESWVSSVLSVGRSISTHIVTYGAMIGQNEVGISSDECARAISAPKTIASGQPIRLEMQGRRRGDDDEGYWKTEIAHLRDAFNEEIRGRLDRRTLQHASVFALAPMPLLIELGALLSDITPADVFQRHREPTQWAWTCDGPHISLMVTKPDTLSPAPLAKLKISISAEIHDERVRSVGPLNAPIWSIKAENPHNDILRYPSDLAHIRSVFRRTIDAIASAHGPDVCVAVFPAMPAACAVELGRIWQPKAHPPLEIYDQTGSRGFVLRHVIEAYG